MTWRTPLTVLLALATCLAGDASAQDAAPSAQPAEAAETPFVGSGWELACASQQAEALACAVSQSVRNRRTGNEIVSISFFPGEAEGTATLRLRAAHGFRVDRGVLFQVDDGEAQRIPFRTSDAQGLGTRAPVAADMVALLLGGERLILAPTGPRGALVALPLPLDTFGALFEEAASLADG